MPKPKKTLATTPFIEKVPTPSRKALEVQWQATFGRPLSPKMRRPLAAQLLRFHAQEIAHGGLSAEVEAYLASLLPKTRGSRPQTAPVPPRRLKPGSRLLRTWRDRTYTVTVADPGFIYEGKTGFYPANTDTSDKPHHGAGGVSCNKEESSATSTSVRRSV